MNNLRRWLHVLSQWFALGFVMGMVYYTVEGLWRIPQGGYANVAMLPVGGLCGVLIGGINQIPVFYHMRMILQSLIGTAIVLAVEFLAGYLLNIRLGMGIWDYSSLPLNLWGQICLPFAGLWLLLMPFCIWLEDYFRLGWWQQGYPYTLLSAYKDFFTCK